MSDNISVTAGSYSGLIASRDLGGAGNPQAQRIVIVGNNGSTWVDVPIVEVQNGPGLGVVSIGDQSIKGVGLRNSGVPGDSILGHIVMVGGRGSNALSQDTPIDDTKLVELAHDRMGRVVGLNIGAPGDRIATTPLSVPSDTADHALIAAQSGFKIELWGFIITGSGADVIFKDGTTQIGRFPAPCVIPSLAAPLNPTTATTALNVALSSGVSGIVVTPIAFKSKL